MNKALNIVIIGTSRGIGIQIARLLTQQGHNLFCISRNKNALEELRDECSRFYPGAGINILGFDVTQIVNDSDILPASIKKLFHGLRAQIF